MHWRHRLAHSLKWRLVALFVALALGTTLLFVAGTRQVISTGWRELVRPLLTDYVDRLSAEVGSPPDLARAQALVQRLPISLRIDGPQLHWQGGTREAADLDDDQGDRGDRGDRGDQGDHGDIWPLRERHDPALRAMLTRTTADGHRLVFGLAAWRWRQQPLAWHWWPLLGLLALTAGGFAYVRRMFRPLDDIHAGAQRYGRGDFSQPIPLRRHDELGELADQVNRMASNLQRMLEGQRGLLLAISHELRSPLTRARLNAELVADGDERQALLRDLGQMRDLIADLLESERLAGGPAALHTEPSDLNALVAEQVQAAQANDVAQAHPADPAAPPATAAIRLTLDPALPLLPLDRARVRLLLRNLLANALQHGHAQPSAAGGWVEVRTAVQASGVCLIVRDHGPGVQPDQLAQLAQPFYRPDAARMRSSGGVGLGLYLCRLVAQSHGGTLAFEDAAPGLRVVLWLPLPAVTPPG
ncbi:MAG: two-component sensor histidine kinase [Burkholderiales bacterium PBB5]|nr:MAG: two-component sensor histidine kinase [Burkholderiales bacterium PBB5]